MTSLPFYWVDAFTDQPFRGNSAAVCPLEKWLPDAQLQTMATQHGLSETAFFVPVANGSYHLRWFTPGKEVDLCGHATLAAAHVLINELGVKPAISFTSKSGPLSVSHSEEGRLVLDFPSRPASPLASDDIPPGLLDALGVDQPEWIGLARDYLIVLKDETAVAGLRPDFASLQKIDAFAFIVTAPGDQCDFVSRFFAPGAGINEDPVTGSAHCTLTPYWANRLTKTRLHARQISTRIGELWCEDLGDRVAIAGQAVTYLKGDVFLR